MPTAIWNGAVIAQARDDEVQIVENNVYFPITAVRQELLQASATHTVCPWKGTASYFSVLVDGKLNVDAAWTYGAPFAAADNIAGHVAFWKGVEVRP